MKLRFSSLSRRSCAAISLASLDSYTGRFVRDTMHGLGEYRWRHRGPHGAFVTYEGNFYGNRMHGYGIMSYPDGRVFNGIYHSNMRWGPGVETQACLNENVGIWRGTQLLRLAWRPSAPNVAVDLMSTYIGRACVEPHRLLLTPRLNIIGETNSAVELLKQSGCEPLTTAARWSELYSNYSNDIASQLCHVDIFNRDYYNGQINILQEASDALKKKEPSSDDQEKLDNYPVAERYYAWNNNKLMVHMMKHCYTHESQRDKFQLDITSVLSGPRNRFRPAAQHELDCRTLLMASYLGHITNVAQLVNEYGVHPDVADIQGNSALMYATCGDQANIIHFLVEAGASIDSYNDSCCIPLGMALLKFACTAIDITTSGIPQTLLPPPTVAPVLLLEEKPVEWSLYRIVPPPNPTNTLNKNPSKIIKMANTKKVKSSMSLKDAPGYKKKTEILGGKGDSNDDGSLESVSEEKRIYYNINNEYVLKVQDLFKVPNAISPTPYIFEINDMVKEINSIDEDQKKVLEKTPKKIMSKVIKDTIKPSKEMMWQNSDKDFLSIDSREKLKNDTLAHNMLTILQLLTDGADPQLVRCPQPALFIAIVSGNADLIRHLVSYGAYVNEVYSQIFNYTALDIAVSRPLTYQNLELIRALLECGADATHRLKYDYIDLNDPLVLAVPGPTLLHAVLAKKADTDIQEEIRRQVIELLLDYNCSPTLQFKGRSALEVVMTKRIDLLDIFIKCPRMNLNAIINSSKQTLLVKMFSVPFCSMIPSSERLQALTNLLLFGADPLAKCQNGEETFQNLFVYAQKVLVTMECPSTKQSSGVGKLDTKAKKVEKPKKYEKPSMKSIVKLGTDDVGDYKQTIDLVTECARLLHIRWLQANLVKDLIDIINKYKHRQWNMILKEHTNKKSTGLWVTASRCLEIWNILKTTKKKIYRDNCVLKHLLYVVHFYNTRPMAIFKQPYMSARDKSIIETHVNYILCEPKMATKLTQEIVPMKRSYVTPELYGNADNKFNVCFECAMPLQEEKIVCSICNLVSFCSQDCMMINIGRTNCHPCSNYLKNIFF